MIQIIEKEDLFLYQIVENKADFVRRSNGRMTDFESFWLKKTGDLLRPKDSQHFWVGGSYCWWVRECDKNGNPVKDHEFSVWLDELGNCMYEDHESGDLYRVKF